MCKKVSIYWTCDLKSADTIKLIKKQSEDSNLTKYFDIVKNGNELFFISDNLLYRHGNVQENRVEQLCSPERCIEAVLQLARMVFQFQGTNLFV